MDTIIESSLSILFVCLLVFNTTFNNISVISWWRKSEDSEKTTDLSQVTDSTPRPDRDTISQDLHVRYNYDIKQLKHVQSIFFFLNFYLRLIVIQSTFKI